MQARNAGSDFLVMHFHAHNSAARRVVSTALAVASLVAVGRVFQLAARGTAPSRAVVAEAFADKGAKAIAAPPLTPPHEGEGNKKVDAELAELYAACPMSRTIDLKTVASAVSPLP